MEPLILHGSCCLLQDSGVAVRKRVIRIMRDICEKQPDYDKVPEMLSRIVRRITDEEGVKKLTLETLQTLLFQPARDRDSVGLINKVIISVWSYFNWGY